MSYSRSGGSNFHQQKPEIVLKRINELIASANGADREKRYALEQLHSIIASKRKHNWSKNDELLMKRHLELCVDLKDHRTAKDGLHQYRNLVQQVDPNSLENVIVYLLDLAETRTASARTKANRVAIAAAAKISDLDQEETPESIMLSTMTVGGLKDRTDRDLVLPWLKFLWETYRSILELLHKNMKLEKAYSKTCERAFAFCVDYQRSIEFRRLCDLLRQQLANIHKQMTQIPSNTLKLSKIVGGTSDWTPESIEIQLQIRFNQLEIATTLEQWNEGFRTVEDIYSIIQLFKKVPKPKLMSIYYEKLTRIFWSSENYLFHAYAWSKYYQLYQEYKKDSIKIDEKNSLASSVLLSALCIPAIRSHSNAGSSSGVDPVPTLASSNNMSWLYDDDDLLFEKNQQMALLLDFQSNPTRDALLGGILAKGVIDDVYPELQQLYTIMETKLSPLTMISDALPIIQFIKSHPLLSQYSILLQRVLVLKCVSQLSNVFSNYKISSLQRLTQSLDLSSIEIEKLLIDSSTGKGKLFQLSIDHSVGCYRFGSQVDKTLILENQMMNLGYSLQNIVSLIDEKASPSTNTSNARSEYFNLIQKSYQQEAQQSLSWIAERKMVIERRKEGLERLRKEKLEQEERRKQEEEELRKQEEAKRLKAEEDERNREKIQKLQELKSIQRLKKTLESYGKVVDENELKQMTEKERRELLQRTQEEAKKSKDDEIKRLAEQWKSLDYKTRVLRLESHEKYKERYEIQVAQDHDIYQQKLSVFMKEAEEKHAIAVEIRDRLSRTRPYREIYEQQITAQQKELYEQKLQAMKDKALDDHRKRKITRARYLKDQEDERIQIELELAQEKAAEEARLAAQVEELRKKSEKERLEREAEERLRREQSETTPSQVASVPRAGNDDDNDEGGPWKRAGGRSSTGSAPSSRPDESWSRRGRDETDDRGRGPSGGDRDGPSESRWGRGSRRDEPSDRDAPRDRDGPSESRWGRGSRRDEPSDRDAPRDRDGPSESRWGRDSRRDEPSDRDAPRDRDGPSESRWGRGSRRDEPSDRDAPRDRDGPSESRWGRGSRRDEPSDRDAPRDRDGPSESRWGRSGPREGNESQEREWNRSEARGPPSTSNRDRLPPSNDEGGWRTVGKEGAKNDRRAFVPRGNAPRDEGTSWRK